MPILKEMRAHHKAERIIVVADKGLNTSDNIAANVLDGNGFVFSQSVRLATGGLKSWVGSETGYKGSEDFRIKDRIAVKTITITREDGKKKKVDIEVREVAFWSRDYAARSKAERAKVIEKSEAAVRRQGVSAAKAHTAVRYVTDTAVVLESGEAAQHVLQIDTDKIAADEAMDGYYCLITSELDKSAEEIIDIYKGLWKIEETFRVTKSTLETRPVYVSRHDRIHAHFMICYVALVLLRLIQLDLDWKHSASEIADDIASIDGVLMKKNYYLFGHRSHLSDKLGALCDIDLSRQILSAKDMRDIFAKTKKS
jgi:transposase